MAVKIDVLEKDTQYGANGVAEVLQNVRTLINTRKGTVPLDRAFGLDYSVLDDPLPSARAKIQADIFVALKKYEPRAILKAIDFDYNALAGQVRPTVHIEVNLNGV